MWELTNFVRFSVHGGGDSGGGVAGGVDGFLVAVEGLLAQSPGEIWANWLPGIAALDNWHPLLVHFPIALLSLFFMLDVLGSFAHKTEWRRTATWFLYLGTVFAALTVAAGLQAAGSVAHGGNVHEIMESHEHRGIAVLSLAVALSAWRLLGKGALNGVANGLFLFSAGVLAILLSLTADLGGLMVYQYGVAVAPVTALNQEAALQHQHGEDEDSHHHDSDIQMDDEPAESAAPAAEVAVEPVPEKAVVDKPAHDHAGHNHTHSHQHTD